MVLWSIVAFVSATGTGIEQSGSAKVLNTEVYDAEVHEARAALEAINTKKRDRRFSSSGTIDGINYLIII